jgi:cyanophycin synthetase
MRALRGPNRYSRYQVITLEIDLKDYEDKPTDKLPDFRKRLLSLVPSLREHRCSPGHPGGFVERLDRGTWLGHVIEHVAIELQCLAAVEVGFGKTYDTEEKGVYMIVYRYKDEEVGLEAGREAVRIVTALASGEMPDLAPVISNLKEIRENNLLGPSTRSIVAEAAARNIPVIRLNRESYVQLGHGVHQRRIQATMTDRTTALGVEIADDKMRTKEMLRSAGIPVPEGDSVEELEDALRLADRIGYPVAVKPIVGNHGRGITVNIENADDLPVAFNAAKRFRDRIIIERNLEGADHRILVIDGNFVAAARRDPPSVTGDGRSTIQELIDKLNEDPRRGFGHEKVLTKVEVDFMTKRLLKQNGKKLADVLAEGEELTLKSTANLSMGGTATDVTDEVHPVLTAMAERISRLVDIDIMGIDIVAPHLKEPLDLTGGAIIEINASPGFRMHLEPFVGTPRNVAMPLVDMLFPPGTHGTIPIIAVTGTNGKTTTVRLISHVLKYSGMVVGFTSTDGVFIGNHRILEGDYSGPEGTLAVLKEPTVDHAVLEVARGGILRRGLAFNESDVGIFLNISEDHIGQDRITSIEELADVKGVVIETVKPEGHAILNADEPLILALKDNVKCKSILFSLDPGSDVLKAHADEGGTVVTVEDETIVIHDKALKFPIVKVNDVPLTLEGRASFNIANVLAAAAACYALGMHIKNIERGLMTFNPSIIQSPGRMNIIDLEKFKVMVDYSHNVAAVRAISEVFPYLSKGKVISMAGGTGSRTDEHIMEFGKALAKVYDRIIVTDSDPRGRPPGETPELVRKGVLDTGFPAGNVSVILDPVEATAAALDAAETGDLVVLQADYFNQVIHDVKEYRKRLLEDR